MGSGQNVTLGDDRSSALVANLSSGVLITDQRHPRPLSQFGRHTADDPIKGLVAVTTPLLGLQQASWEVVGISRWPSALSTGTGGDGCGGRVGDRGACRCRSDRLGGRSDRS